LGLRGARGEGEGDEEGGSRMEGRTPDIRGPYRRGTEGRRGWGGGGEGEVGDQEIL